MTLEIFKLIIKFLGIVIWPVTVVVLVCMFRNEIRRRIGDLKEVEFPGGFKAKLQAKVEDAVEEITDEIREIDADEKMGEEEKQEMKKKVLIEKFKIVEEEIESATENSPTQDKANKRLLVFAAGDSVSMNKKYNIYYDPVERNHNRLFRYIGLYHSMKVVAVGEVQKIVPCDYVDGKVVVKDSNQTLTFEESERIRKTIEETDYYNLRTGNKFFLVDKFYDTNFKKKSSYAMRAKKYFLLDEINGFKEGVSAEQLARLLDGKEWE